MRPALKILDESAEMSVGNLILEFGEQGVDISECSGRAAERSNALIHGSAAEFHAFITRLSTDLMTALACRASMISYADEQLKVSESGGVN